MAKCIITSCKKPVHGHGYCSKHYLRWKRHGSPHITRKKPNGSKHINPWGYVMIYIDGKQIREHRHFMEQHLNRKLKSSEVVHHINGIRHDNRIKNLQIMNTSAHSSFHNLTCYRGKTHKQCSKCRKLLPRTSFSRHGKTLDHLRSECKTCQNKVNMKRLHHLKHMDS